MLMPPELRLESVSLEQSFCVLTLLLLFGVGLASSLVFAFALFRVFLELLFPSLGVLEPAGNHGDLLLRLAPLAEAPALVAVRPLSLLMFLSGSGLLASVLGLGRCVKTGTPLSLVRALVVIGLWLSALVSVFLVVVDLGGPDEASTMVEAELHSSLVPSGVVNVSRGVAT